MSMPSPPYQTFDGVRKSLIADGSYVGYRDFNRGKFIWTRDDFEHRLVEKSPDIPADNSESFEFSMIVKIPFLNFFLTSCAMWSGPTGNPIVNALHKAKASCLGQAPADEVLASDYERAMMNIGYLVDGIRRPGVEHRGLFIDGKIRFRHILFEPMSVVPDKPALTPEFSLQNWPADSTKVQPYLEELKVANSYRPIPLPAYDLGGDLIRPGLYQDSLQGATVVIYFALCHYNLGEVDGLLADITYIRVLAPPRALATAPRERNTRLSDPKLSLTPMHTVQSPPSSPSPSACSGEQSRDGSLE